MDVTGAQAVETTLEQIDLVKDIAQKYPADFEMAYSAADVERIHARFDDVGEQLHEMHCTYPFGGWPGQEDCRFEPAVTYDSDAHKAEDA